MSERLDSATGTNNADALLTFPKVPSAISDITVYSPSREGGNVPVISAILANE